MFGVVLLESIFSYVYAMPSGAGHGPPSNPQAVATMLDGFRYAFWFGAGCLILALIAISRLPTRQEPKAET